VTRDIVIRIKSGLYALVPFEYRKVSDFAPNVYLVAKALAEPNPYYLSHGTAMELHRMTTQPRLDVFISSTRRRKKESLLGTEYHFVRRNRAAMFGTIQHWVSSDTSVTISDSERTIIDGLAEPQYVGGISEVAKAIVLVRGTLDVNRLIDYSKRLGIGAVTRRLGYLLELYALASADILDHLRGQLSASIEVLDPTLPPEGRFTRRWRLHVNVSPEELRLVAMT
jgi:predicted transcriptional regulator of viral defense system